MDLYPTFQPDWWLERLDTKIYLFNCFFFMMHSSVGIVPLHDELHFIHFMKHYSICWNVGSHRHCQLVERTEGMTQMLVVYSHSHPPSVGVTARWLGLSSCKQPQKKSEELLIWCWNGSRGNLSRENRVPAQRKPRLHFLIYFISTNTGIKAYKNLFQS